MRLVGRIGLQQQFCLSVTEKDMAFEIPAKYLTFSTELWDFTLQTYTNSPINLNLA